MGSSGKAFAFVFGVLVFSAAAPAAKAAFITITESAIASGSLGSSSFVNSLITLTETSDTSDVSLFAPFIFLPGSATINIASLGTTANFTDGISVVAIPSDDLAGFNDNNILKSDGNGDTFILGTVDSAFVTYSLTTSVGPITDSSFAGMNPVGYGTNDGLLQIKSVAADSTFTASVSPEPATMVLFGSGLAALTWRKRAQGF